MKAEIYYVIGKPASLKHEFFNKLHAVSQDEDFLRIPRLFTTDPTLQTLDNIYYIDERDFELRHSMGIYCLNWEKSGYKYGVCGEGAQWVQNGYSVVVNGSLHNLDQALRTFPELNVVLLRQEGEDELIVGNTLIESDVARLDWVNSVNGICCPYVLSIVEADAVTRASQLLLELIEYNRGAQFDKAG